MRQTWDSGERSDLPAELGEVIGAYRLDAVIGRGGMSCVYAATHLKLERRVALKVLLPGLADDAAYVERFFHEARIVNAVRHPNIVDISDFLELENPRRVACVMDLLEGKTLRQVLIDQPLTELQALDVSMQLASALGAVHQVGVVHRDLKPANIVVTGEVDPASPTVPQIRLLDFGVAKRPEWLAAKTSSPGHLVGTPAYMSPEQIDGVVEPAADIYALGVILYEMLAGEPLFAGEAISVLMSKVTFDPVPLKLPMTLKMREEFAVLISACIDPHQSRRPTIGELQVKLADLYALVLSGPQTIPETEPPKAVRRRASKNPYVRFGVAAFALAAAVMLWTGFETPSTAISAPPPAEELAELLPPLAEPELSAEEHAELVPENTIEEVPSPELTSAVVPSVEPKRARATNTNNNKSQRGAQPLTRDDLLPW